MCSNKRLLFYSNVNVVDCIFRHILNISTDTIINTLTDYNIICNYFGYEDPDK